MLSISTRLLRLSCLAASPGVRLDQPAHAVNRIAVAHGYGRQANCPV